MSDVLNFRFTASVAMRVKKGLETVETAQREATKVGKRGTVVIPARMRHRLRIEEGSLVIVEEREGGVYIRPAMVVPMDPCTPERKAQFLLSGAVDAKDYARAVKEVRRLGLDPKKIHHYKPPDV